MPDFLFAGLVGMGKGMVNQAINGPLFYDLFLSPLRGWVISCSNPGLAPRAVVLRRFAARLWGCDGFQFL